MQRGIFRGKDMTSHARPHSAVSCAKTAELIEIQFGLWTWLGPRKHVLHGGAHCRRLANTFEPSTCGGDAAFLSNYFDHLFYFKTELCETIIETNSTKCRIEGLNAVRCENP